MAYAPAAEPDERRKLGLFWTIVRFIDTTFPIIMVVGEAEHGDEQLRQLRVGWERFFARGERYASINYYPKNTKLPDAKTRKSITDWASSPRIHEMSAKYCVGAAVVLQSAVTRGAFTALTWVWKPAFPQKAVATLDDAVAYCADQLAAADVPLRRSIPELIAMLRRETGE